MWAPSLRLPDMPDPEANNAIGVIGAGAWGTALAVAALRGGCSVTLWAREAEVVETIHTSHRNILFLPDVELDPALAVTSSLDAVVAQSNVLLLSVPAQFMRATCRALAPILPPHVPVVVCAKGIEQGTHDRMSTVITAELPGQPFAILSGPTFAEELARGLPTAAVVACTDSALAQSLAERLGSATFRLYYSDDVVGAEIGGAVKNVLAIACGIGEGRGMGHNTRAALVTRGLAELTRLALQLGARLETMMGLSGLGDLLLTATSVQSRNYSLGVALGRGQRLADILAERRSVAEGVWTAGALMALCQDLGVDMPICAAVDAVLNHGADLDQAIRSLLDRPLKTEV